MLFCGMKKAPLLKCLISIFGFSMHISVVQGSFNRCNIVVNSSLIFLLIAFKSNIHKDNRNIVIFFVLTNILKLTIYKNIMAVQKNILLRNYK